ncbi:MAG: SAM-dependent methyltransferase [Alphaproteobacteria bacterium]|nr:SAM-dependent methyltransferase [Alphaproteobacteria bacterium]
MNKCSLIKSCTRVRDLGEVFTPLKIVHDMCKLIPKKIWQQIDSTFLEPSCGTGNFLAEILSRKLRQCKTVDDCIIAIQSLYGVDIMADNINECKCRLLDVFLHHIQKCECMCLMWEQIEQVMHILDTNIICGNTLTMLDANGDDLKFKDWKTGEFETLKHMLGIQDRPAQETLPL